MPEQIAEEPPVPCEGKRNIQMIASTCLLIAAKFSDRKLPPLSELEKVHHGQCKADDFAALELRILDRLLWKLLVPLPHAFIDHLRDLCVDAPFTTTIEDRMLLMQDQKASVAAKSCDQSLSKAQLRSNTLDGLILDFFDDDKVCLCLF